MDGLTPFFSPNKTTSYKNAMVNLETQTQQSHSLGQINNQLMAACFALRELEAIILSNCQQPDTTGLLQLSSQIQELHQSYDAMKQLMATYH